MLTLLLALAAGASDAPRQVVLLPETGALVVAQPAVDAPTPLVEARKLADQLRYEEAVIEYQRYLGLPERPVRERANALVELGFIHLVLGDERTAEDRALQALELDPNLEVPASAPGRQQDFLSRLKKEFQTRPRLKVEPRQDDDDASVVRVSMADPQKRVKSVLLRHGLAASGPFHSTEMRCEGTECMGNIPPPVDASSFTAWYYVEAHDAAHLTLARAATPDSPLQLAVVGRKPWYTSPIVWGLTGAGLVAVSAVVFFLAPPPPQ